MRGHKQEQEEEREIRGTGNEFRKLFCSLQPLHAVLCNQTNTKLLIVAFLYDDDNIVSHPLVGSLVRSGLRFFNDFIIGVKSFMRVTNVNLIWETLDKVPNAFPDLHLATRGGSYPYSICYMAFSLRQTKNAKFLIRIGADYLESNSNHNSLPSYLLEYCKSGKADYLSWLFSTLSTSNLEKLIKRITTDGGDYDTVDSGKIEATSSHFERNLTHALLLSGNEHVTRELLGRGPQDSCNILCVKVDLKQRTALHIAAEMGQEESVKTIIEM